MKSLPRSLAWLGECAYQHESTVTAMASKNLLIKMMIDCKWLLLSAYRTTVVMRGHLHPLQQLAEPCVFPPPPGMCRDAFKALPAWKKQQKKKDVNLF